MADVMVPSTSASSSKENSPDKTDAPAGQMGVDINAGASSSSAAGAATPAAPLSEKKRRGRPPKKNADGAVSSEPPKKRTKSTPQKPKAPKTPNTSNTVASRTRSRSRESSDSSDTETRAPKAKAPKSTAKRGRSTSPVARAPRTNKAPKTPKKRCSSFDSDTSSVTQSTKTPPKTSAKRSSNNQSDKSPASRAPRAAKSYKKPGQRSSSTESDTSPVPRSRKALKTSAKRSNQLDASPVARAPRSGKASKTSKKRNSSFDSDTSSHIAYKITSPTRSRQAQKTTKKRSQINTSDTSPVTRAPRSGKAPNSNKKRNRSDESPVTRKPKPKAPKTTRKHNRSNQSSDDSSVDPDSSPTRPPKTQKAAKILKTPQKNKKQDKKQAATPLQSSKKNRVQPMPAQTPSKVKSLPGKWWIPNNEPEPEYNMMLKKKVLQDDKIDEDVEHRGGETPAVAYEQVERDVAAAEANGDTAEWKLDYIIASTDKNKTNLVAKYTNYALCSLMERLPKTYVPVEKACIDFWLRSTIMDVIEVRLKREQGSKAYSERYGHRYATAEEGATESAFVTKAVTLYKNRLRALEWRVCHEMDKVHQPPVYYENWTGKEPPLPKFNYTSILLPSKRVKRALSCSTEFAHYTCKETTCKDGESCPSFLLNRKDKEKRTCCKIIKEGNIVDGNPVECTSECGCDPEICGNRVLQHGRQFPIVIWADWRKGWTALAATKIRKGAFVGEYTGEVLTPTEAKQRDDHSYHMEMPNLRAVEEPEKKRNKAAHEKLVIDGLAYGNETRYISHSCDPNLELVVCYVERHGGWYSRMAFVTKRDIEIGEELTFDYFPKLKYEDRETNTNDIFVNCFCESARCKFSKTAEAVKLREDDMKARLDKIEEEKGVDLYDSWSDCSEEESEAQKEEKRQKVVLARRDRADRRSVVREEVVTQAQINMFVAQQQREEKAKAKARKQARQQLQQQQQQQQQQ